MPARKRNKKNKGRRLVLLLLSVFILTLAAALILTYEGQIRYYMMGLFEEPVDLKNDYSIHGIDVSRWQKEINWKTVSRFRSKGKKISFVFIKATEGINKQDPYFEKNWRGAARHGLIKGAYHYFLYNEDPQKQAENFIRRVSLKSMDLPPVIDIEVFNGEDKRQFRNDIKAFLEIVTAHYGLRPILYTNPLFYERYLRNQFEDYPLWIAHYRTTFKPTISRNWHFWQYTEKGRISGIPHDVDINVFNGDMEDLKKLLVP